MLPVGDHQVIFGQVSAVRGLADETALLLRHHRHYLSTGQAVTPPAADGYRI